jgi:hypothetical protein
MLNTNVIESKFPSQTLISTMRAAALMNKHELLDASELESLDSAITHSIEMFNKAQANEITMNNAAKLKLLVALSHMSNDQVNFSTNFHLFRQTLSESFENYN